MLSKLKLPGLSDPPQKQSGNRQTDGLHDLAGPVCPLTKETAINVPTATSSICDDEVAHIIKYLSV